MTGASLHAELRGVVHQARLNNFSRKPPRLITTGHPSLNRAVFHPLKAWSRSKPALAPRSGSLQWSWGEL